MNSSSITAEEAALIVYSQNIEDLAKSNKNEDFFNSGNKHAMVVLKTIAKYAIKEIKIFAANLCTEVSNNADYISNLRDFLSSGGKMEVILCDYPIDNNHLELNIYKLFNEFSKSVTVKRTTTKVKTSNGTPVHFTIADSKMYRFEVDVVNKVAKGNFNDPTYTSYLDKIFNQLFNDPNSQIISA